LNLDIFLIPIKCSIKCLKELSFLFWGDGLVLKGEVNYLVWGETTVDQMKEY